MKKVKHMYLDFSSYSEYLKCPRKFAWNLIEQLDSKVKGDPTTGALFKGTLIHECIDALYCGKDWQDRFKELIPQGSAITELADDRSGSVLHLKKIMENYVKKYNAPEDTEFQVTFTEQRMEMILTPWLTFCGTVDKIALMRDDKSPVVVDHKTSSSLNSFMKPTIEVSDQFTGYIALSQANGIDTNKLIIDGISTAMKALKENEGLFERYLTIRSIEQVNEWKARVIKVAGRMKDDIETGEFVSNQPTACNLYHSRCIYYDACAVAGQTRINVIKNKFEKSTNPWKNFKITLAD